MQSCDTLFSVQDCHMQDRRYYKKVTNKKNIHKTKLQHPHIWATGNNLKPTRSLQNPGLRFGWWEQQCLSCKWQSQGCCKGRLAVGSCELLLQRAADTLAGYQRQPYSKTHVQHTPYQILCRDTPAVQSQLWCCLSEKQQSCYRTSVLCPLRLKWNFSILWARHRAAVLRKGKKYIEGY